MNPLRIPVMVWIFNEIAGAFEAIGFEAYLRYRALRVAHYRRALNDREHIAWARKLLES